MSNIIAPDKLRRMEARLYMAINDMYNEMMNEGGLDALQAWAAENSDLSAALDMVQEILEPRVRMTEEEAYAAVAGRSTFRQGYGGE